MRVSATISLNILSGSVPQLNEIIAARGDEDVGRLFDSAVDNFCLKHYEFRQARGLDEPSSGPTGRTLPEAGALQPATVVSIADRGRATAWA